MKKFIFRTIVLLVFVVGIIIGALFMTFESPELKKALEQNLKTTTKRDISIGKVSIKPIEGIKIEDFVMGNMKGFSRGDFLKVKGIVLKYELFALLNKRFKIKKIEFNTPGILLERNKRGVFNFDDLTKLGSTKKKTETGDNKTELPSFIKEMSFLISRLSLTNGNVKFVDRKGKKTVLTSIKDIDLNVKKILLNKLETSSESILKNLSLSGDFGIVSLDYDGYKAGNLKTNFTLEKGIFKMSSFNMNAYEGGISGRVRANLLKKHASYECSTSINKLNVNKILAEKSKIKNTLLGPLKHKGDISGVAGYLTKLNGKGNVEMEPGKLKNIPGLEKAAELLGLDYLRNLQYSAITGNYTIKNGIVDTPDLTVVAVGLRMSARGKVNLPKNTMDYTINLKISPEIAGKIVSQKLSMIPKDSDGGLTVEIGVKGPLTNPRVDYSKMFKRMFKNIFGDVKGKLKDIIKGGKPSKKTIDNLKKGAADQMKKLKGLF